MIPLKVRSADALRDTGRKVAALDSIPGQGSLSGPPPRSSDPFPWALRWLTASDTRMGG